MRRRGLFLFVLLSACAPAVVAPPPVAEHKAPVLSADAPPVPPPAALAPSVAATLPPTVSIASLPSVSGGVSFEVWRKSFVDKAVALGFDRSFVEGQLATAVPNPSIVGHDSGQPEFSKPISDYVHSAVSPAREVEGEKFRDSHVWMTAIEAKYGVPREILLSIWSQESGFGKVQGDYDVISAFATLAYDGRRREWAETQLLDALTIIRDRGIPRSKLKGSWAGAMGQTQFIPEAYLRLGADGDGDGKVDIWGSPADALASAANHLSTEGWKRGESWAVEVIPPAGFDYSCAETDKHAPAWWAAHGVRRADGRPWSKADAGEEAVLLVPAGANGPAFLAFPNHFVIRKYNNSIAYALSIGLMADAMRGAPPLARPWPHEIPLSREQRYATQLALAKLGYTVGPPDGLIGAGTRAALRGWQKKNGLVADGYLTPQVVAKLTASAG
jgi:membrane-bound lytic murein transglycosylase B